MEHPFEIHEDSAYDDPALLRLKGEFDSFFVYQFTKEIEQRSNRSVSVILNMRFLRFINSTALGALIKASRALRLKGLHLVISAPSGSVRHTIESVGLNRALTVCASDEEALQYIKRQDAALADDSGPSAPFEFLLDPSLSEGDAAFVLRTLRLLYAACGGVGFSYEVDFEYLPQAAPARA